MTRRMIRTVGDYYLAIALGPKVSDETFLRMRDSMDELMARPACSDSRETGESPCEEGMSTDV